MMKTIAYFYYSIKIYLFVLNFTLFSLLTLFPCISLSILSLHSLSLQTNRLDSSPSLSTQTRRSRGSRWRDGDAAASVDLATMVEDLGDDNGDVWDSWSQPSSGHWALANSRTREIFLNFQHRMCRLALILGLWFTFCRPAHDHLQFSALELLSAPAMTVV